MKRLIALTLFVVFSLAGCSSLPQSDEPCISCGDHHAYVYEIDTQTFSYCKDCYEARKASDTKLDIDMKNGIN